MSGSRRFAGGAVTLALSALGGWRAGNIVGLLIAVVVVGLAYLLVTWEPIWKRVRFWEKSEALVPAVESSPVAPQSRPRTGVINRPGGKANVRRGKFGEKLDIGIENEDELDAEEAEFGVTNGDSRERGIESLDDLTQ